MASAPSITLTSLGLELGHGNVLAWGLLLWKWRSLWQSWSQSSGYWKTRRLSWILTMVTFYCWPTLASRSSWRRDTNNITFFSCSANVFREQYKPHVNPCCPSFLSLHSSHKKILSQVRAAYSTYASSIRCSMHYLITEIDKAKWALDRVSTLKISNTILSSSLASFIRIEQVVLGAPAVGQAPGVLRERAQGRNSHSTGREGHSAASTPLIKYDPLCSLLIYLLFRPFSTRICCFTVILFSSLLIQSSS